VALLLETRHRLAQKWKIKKEQEMPDKDPLEFVDLIDDDNHYKVSFGVVLDNIWICADSVKVRTEAILTMYEIQKEWNLLSKHNDDWAEPILDGDDVQLAGWDILGSRKMTS
jgi:hypothetical protein